jgi:hypothetical protein
MSSSPCGEDFTCEECGDKNACDIYYKEKGFQQLEEQYIEDRKEREHAKKEAQ